jgi:hypothetical protein
MAPPTTAPPTTARRVVRRATPATLTGVNGRPTRACALSTDSKRPSFSDHPTEPEIPHATTAAVNKARFRPICLITGSFPYSEATTVPELTLRTLDLYQCSTKRERAADTHETGRDVAQRLDSHPLLSAAATRQTHMSPIGTFETCQPALRMSVYRGGAEVTRRLPKQRD